RVVAPWSGGAPTAPTCGVRRQSARSACGDVVSACRAAYQGGNRSTRLSLRHDTRFTKSDEEADTQSRLPRIQWHYGGMAEWSMAVVLKTTVLARVPGVRIPLPPPEFSII